MVLQPLPYHSGGCFVNLFYLAYRPSRDWAIKVERGQAEQPPPTPAPKKSLRDIYQQTKELAEDKKRIAAWVPRKIILGDNVPVTGNPSDFGEGTPEQKLVEYLYYWMHRNYEYMARCLAYFERENPGKAAGEIRARYVDKQLTGFELLSIEDGAAAVTTIKVKVVYEENGQAQERELDIRLINEDTSGNPAARGKPGSGWALYTGYL